MAAFSFLPPLPPVGKKERPRDPACRCLVRVRLWHTSGCHSSRPAWRQDRRHIAHALAEVLVQKENVLTASAMTAFGLLLASTLVASICSQSEASGRQLQTAGCFDDSQC